MIQVLAFAQRSTSADFFEFSLSRLTKTRLTKTLVPKGWSSNIKLEKSKSLKQK